MTMTIAKVARHFQVTVPREIRKISGLREGELVKFDFRDGKIIMTPASVVDKSQAYFFTKKWQKEIKRSEGQIKSGKFNTYHNSKALEKSEEIKKTS